MGKDYEKEIDLDDPNDHYAKMIDLVGRDKRVVDFGCSTGFVSRALRERGCHVTGIEIDPAAAEKAAEACDRVVVADLDVVDLDGELGGEKYDVGLFGDVVEHLKDPKRLLSQMRAHLVEGGYIVLSVPNIAHASVRLMLLEGRFDYEQTGILDDTHLRFYTRDSIADLVESCGYMVDVIDWSEQRISEEKLRAALDPLGLANLEEVVKAFSTWESVAFQYVVRAFPAGEEEQVRRLSEEKVQAERRLRTLEREVEELRKARDYMKDLEEQIDKKNRYIKMLEGAVSERDLLLQEKDRRIDERAGRVESLKASRRRPSRTFGRRK